MKLNLARLNSIKHTLEAIEQIDQALEWYKDAKPGPAYMSVSPPGSNEVISLQFEREHFRKFMTERRAYLIQHLEERFDGFEYDADADWTGDKTG